MPQLPDPGDPHLEDGDEWDDEDDGWDEDNDLVSLKYMFEGVATIAGLSDSLRRLADELDRQGAAGWRLAAPVDNGYAHLTRAGG